MDINNVFRHEVINVGHMTSHEFVSLESMKYFISIN